MTDNYPYGRQTIDDDDIQAVVDVLRSDFLTTGPKVVEFEKELSSVAEAEYALACSNGTTALHLAADAIGLKKGDIAIVPTITFLATANAVRFTGADVVFCDVDPDTGLMTAETLEAAIATVSDKSKIKAVFPVHMKGLCVDLLKIREVADKYGLFIIADACHAIGGQLHGHAVGACKFEDMTIFSFHPVKTIAMGEGGAVTTRNPDWHNKLLKKRGHGVVQMPEEPFHEVFAFDKKSNRNPWYYEMPDIGYNYRATDMQCALGISQLKKIRQFVKRREEITALYDEHFQDLSPKLELPVRLDYCQPGWHLYAPRFNFDEIGKTRSEIITELRQHHIFTQVHYFPVHLQPYYMGLYGKKELPGAMTYYEKTLSLPLYPQLSDRDVLQIIQILKSIL